MLEYVSSSYRQRGYWRRRSYTRDYPTIAQRKARSQFAEIAHFEGIDKFGTVIVGDNKVIPNSANVIKEKMKPITKPLPTPIPTILDMEVLIKIILSNIFVS